MGIVQRIFTFMEVIQDLMILYNLDPEIYCKLLNKKYLLKYIGNIILSIDNHMGTEYHHGNIIKCSNHNISLLIKAVNPPGQYARSSIKFYNKTKRMRKKRFIGAIIYATEGKLGIIKYKGTEYNSYIMVYTNRGDIKMSISYFYNALAHTFTYLANWEEELYQPYMLLHGVPKFDFNSSDSSDSSHDSDLSSD